MKILDQPLPGVFLLKPGQFADQRGVFVKTFQAEVFSELGFPFTPMEEYFSCSRRHVIRGMHCQLPPFDHQKVVYCIQGRVLDVLLDIRPGSVTFGQAVSVELSASNQIVVLIPKGFAHGFLSLADDSVMVYKTSTVHTPSHDVGIRWDSFGFDWKLTATPILSARDSRFPSLADFPAVV